MSQKLEELGPGTIGWLAGWLEGEGTFKLDHNTPTICVNSVDEDTIIKAYQTYGGHKYGPYLYENSRVKRQPFYIWTLTGTVALEMLTTLLPHMSSRRKDQIKKVISGHDPELKNKAMEKRKETWRKKRESKVLSTVR